MVIRGHPGPHPGLVVDLLGNLALPDRRQHGAYPGHPEDLREATRHGGGHTLDLKDVPRVPLPLGLPVDLLLLYDRKAVRHHLNQEFCPFSQSPLHPVPDDPTQEGPGPAVPALPVRVAHVPRPDHAVVAQDRHATAPESGVNTTEGTHP